MEMTSSLDNYVPGGASNKNVYVAFAKCFPWPSWSMKKQRKGGASNKKVYFEFPKFSPRPSWSMKKQRKGSLKQFRSAMITKGRRNRNDDDEVQTLNAKNGCEIQENG